MSKVKRLTDNRHMLYVLKNANIKLRKAILKNASPELIKTICEISYNTLNGNNKICGKTIHKLRKYKRELRSLAKLKGTTGSKRKIIIQRGHGFIPTLLGTVLSGLIGAALDKYAKSKADD
jgi:hypothetical protein